MSTSLLHYKTYLVLQYWSKIQQWTWTTRETVMSVFNLLVSEYRLHVLLNNLAFSQYTYQLTALRQNMMPPYRELFGLLS